MKAKKSKEDDRPFNGATVVSIDIEAEMALEENRKKYLVPSEVNTDQ